MKEPDIVLKHFVFNNVETRRIFPAGKDLELVVVSEMKNDPGPAQVAESTPMTALNIGVYKLPPGGTFNFSTWTGTGGIAYTLNVNNGSVTSTQAGGNIY